MRSTENHEYFTHAFAIQRFSQAANNTRFSVHVCVCELWIALNKNTKISLELLWLLCSFNHFLQYSSLFPFYTELACHNISSSKNKITFNVLYALFDFTSHIYIPTHQRFSSTTFLILDKKKKTTKISLQHSQLSSTSKRNTCKAVVRSASHQSHVHRHHNTAQ